jgi:4-azaleucine resistance transporter AzlC
METQQAAQSIRGRDIAAVAVAVVAYGLAFGALATASGLTVAHVAVMSLLVFAGGSQFAFVGVIAAGGSPMAGAVAGLLLNTRLTAFGMMVAPVLTGGRLRRLAGTHLMSDENTAMTAAAPPDEKERVYWRVSMSIFLAWNLSTVIGALLGAGLDPEVFGLDVAFPATFVALLVPLLRQAGAVTAAVAGFAVAVGLTPLLPPGVPVSLAVVGVAAGVVARTRRPSDDAGALQ